MNQLGTGIGSLLETLSLCFFPERERSREIEGGSTNSDNVPL